MGSPGQGTPRTMGTISCGYETMSQAWGLLDHVFSVDGANTKATHAYPDPRYSKKLLERHPVDILVVDQGNYSMRDQQRNNPGLETHWESLVMTTRERDRPNLVLESWNISAAGWEQGPMGKGPRTRWDKGGYNSRYHIMDATKCQGAIKDQRLIIARVRKGSGFQWKWPEPQKSTQPRPMSNLLTPWGLLPRQVKRQSPKNENGRTFPDSRKDPMPNCVGAWIRTEKGVRRLQTDEVLKGLGGQKAEDQRTPTAKDCRQTTSLFIWEALSASVSGTNPQGPESFNLYTGWRSLGLETAETIASTPAEGENAFEWKPPDLKVGSCWHAERVKNLRAAANLYPGREADLFEKGMAILETHRENYDSTGANLKKLQLIWWEFPREHWDAIREGSHMGFLVEPPHIIHPNSEMDEDERKVAAQFIDELMEVGAIGRPRKGQEPVTNTPLFCVPKPYQPGQWRVIADCKAGGQNACIGNDPVYLNRPLHILGQMYTGGYTAVVDASKFFHQFFVHPEDRKYLGLVHPVTGEHLIWEGLPMGAGSSPSLAGQYGLSFLRLLREKGASYQKTAKPNCWWTGFREEGYDPTLGYGFSLSKGDGSPAVKVWVHVDDFAVHGPSLESTTAALKELLDLTVDVGLLCHPKKLQPPSQYQQYVGFIFDTRAEPFLRIPEHKHERCQVMAQYVLDFPAETKMSRLALSVVAGTLESVADATPNRLGHTYLRSTYDLIHPGGEDSGPLTYYTSTHVTEDVRREMRWWLRILEGNRGRPARGKKSGTLIPSWGDGSGTGTGGTIQVPDEPLKMWMGQWSPVVYSHSSNWKELKTLLLTLQHLKSGETEKVRGTTVFYFTDNSTTYWVVRAGASRSPGLHALVEQILLLSSDLEIILEVIHVPGIVMIEQCTDGLSRGVWATNLQEHIPQDKLNEAVFAPLPVDMDLAFLYIERYSLQGRPVYHHWNHYWGKGLFDHLSVWFPPPELGQAVLIGILEAWVERPHTTSALLFIPRTALHGWSGLSRHVQELDTIFPTQTPLRWSHLPYPKDTVGTPRKLRKCAGCYGKFKGNEGILTCTFHVRGFGGMKPCGTLYHPRCIKAGEPFTSRRTNAGGLTFPAVQEWPNFVCELCTVRAVVGRELGHPGDKWLMQLERVRCLDIAHNWAPGTLVAYQTQLRKVRRFERTHPGVHILTNDTLVSPPRGPEIAMMWVELHASASVLKERGRLAERTPTYGTIRQLRSALSQYHTLKLLNAEASGTYFSERRAHLVGPCRPTDAAAFTLFQKGLSARIGDNPIPSTALLGRHVWNLERYFKDELRRCRTRTDSIQWGTARVANLVLWLGWTRSRETFGLRWGDISIIPPNKSESHDLPKGCGAVLLRMSPETKSNRVMDSDIVIAYTTKSGLSLGESIMTLHGLLLERPRKETPLFVTGRGQVWDSEHYRLQYLYPGLEKLQFEGDAFLMPLQGQIQDKFWSLHCYRRGARGHCQRTQHSTTHKKATNDQVYEHARWRQQRSHEKVDILYREWTIRDRVAITLHSH